MTAASPRPAAPDTTGGELRERAEAICMDMPGVDFDDNGESWERKVDYVAAALRDLLAERDKLAAQVAEQRALLDRNHRAYLIAIGVDPDYSPMPERRPATDEGTAG